MLQLTPAPGVTPEALAAEMTRRSRSSAKCRDPHCYACNGAEYAPSGPTARWVERVSDTQVRCPTCGDIIDLAAFLTHGCGMVSRHQAWGGPGYGAPMPRPLVAPKDRPLAAPRKYWTGDVPATCDHCTQPIKNGFADSPLPGRKTWGILCGLCWSLHGRSPGRWYQKTRSGKWWMRKEV